MGQLGEQWAGRGRPLAVVKENLVCIFAFPVSEACWVPAGPFSGPRQPFLPVSSQCFHKSLF